jgi:hypothetical protein
VWLEGNELVLVAVEPQVDGPFRLHDFLALADQLDEVDGTRVVRIRRVSVPMTGALVAAALLVLALVSTTVRPDPARRVASERAATSTVVPVAEPGTAHAATTAVGGPSTTPEPRATTATTRAPLAPACPPGEPAVDLLQAVPELGGSIRNDTGAVALVHSIVVHGVVVPIQLEVPAHSSVPWRADAPAGTPAADLEAGLGEWEWVRCP